MEFKCKTCRHIQKDLSELGLTVSCDKGYWSTQETLNYGISVDTTITNRTWDGCGEFEVN